MAEARRCPSCGAELPAGAPEGLCPACLLKEGFSGRPESEPGSDPEAATTPHGPAPDKAAPAATTPAGGRFVAPEAEQLSAFFPQLEILELLGAGGMGAVYKARQPKLDRLVAVKILPRESAADAAFAERFAREARALARLSHPHVVTVYDFGETSGLFYFVMEYVDGVNVRQMLQSDALEPNQALAIVPQICEALAYAHEEGIVHRDIKPENILLDKRGRVKIADFGLAKLMSRTAEDFSLTHTQQVMGTPHYMAPEQIESPQQVDHRADIYSLGVVFYEMLTGELPIGRFEPPSHRVQVDVRLDEVVLKSLEKRPERRYQLASDVKTDVESISGSDVTPSQRTSPPPPAGPREAVAGDIESAAKRVRIPAIGLIVAGLIDCGLSIAILLIGLFAVFGLDSGASATAPPARVGVIYGPLVLMVLMPIFGVIKILGGAQLLRLRTLGLVQTAAVVSLLPCSPSVLLSLPFSIWTLVLLNKPDVASAFSAAPRKSASHSRQLLWPAIGLILAGMIDFAESIFFAGLYFSDAPGAGLALVAFWGVPPIILGAVRIAGGVQMLRMKSHAFAVVSSITSLLPITWGAAIGLPAGIWALVVVAKQEVKDAFERAKPRSGSDQLREAIDPEEAQRTAELAEIPPGWLALVVVAAFMFGWLVVGAMWNLRTAGLLVGFAALSAITYGVVRFQVVYSPKLRAELARQSKFRRGLAFVCGGALFMLAMMFVVSTQVAVWDLMGHPWDPNWLSSMPGNASGADAISEFSLDKLVSLDYSNGEQPSIALDSWRYASLGPKWFQIVTLALYAFMATTIAALSVAVVVNTRRYGHTWKNCWSLSVSTAVLLMMALVFVHVGRFLPGYSTAVFPPREVRSAATSGQLETAIDAWAEQNGYDIRAERTWRIYKGDSDRVGTVRMLELSAPSPFERYRVAGRFVVSPLPAMRIKCVSLDEPAESYVSADLPVITKGSEEETTWPALLDGLQTAIETPSSAIESMKPTPSS